jgi:hypothetical protein
MNWNDWEFVWRRQPLPAGKNADLDVLLRTFEAKRLKTARMLFLRDVMEAAAGVLVAAALAGIWISRGPSAWPIGAAMVLVLGVSGCFVRERLRAQQHRVSPHASLRVKIEAELAELRHQRLRLRRIWLWYLGPIGAAIGIVFATLVARTSPYSPLRDPVIVTGFGLFFTACLIFAWLVNRHAARTQLDPRIAELEKLHQAVLSESPPVYPSNSDHRA